MNFIPKNLCLAAFAVLAIISLNGCAATGANGLIYNNTKVPLYIAPFDSSLGPRVGVATTHDVLGLVSWGDAGTLQAALNGGVTQIRTVDVGTYNLLGIYSEKITKVDGLGHGPAPNGVNYYAPGQ